MTYRRGHVVDDPPTRKSRPVPPLAKLDSALFEGSWRCALWRNRRLLSARSTLAFACARVSDHQHSLTTLARLPRRPRGPRRLTRCEGMMCKPLSESTTWTSRPPRARRRRPAKRRGAKVRVVADAVDTNRRGATNELKDARRCARASRPLDASSSTAAFQTVRWQAEEIFHHGRLAGVGPRAAFARGVAPRTPSASFPAEEAEVAAVLRRRAVGHPSRRGPRRRPPRTRSAPCTPELVERSLLGLLQDVLPVGVAPGRGRRPWCLTRRCEARTSSADMAALGWSEDAVVGRRVLQGARRRAPVSSARSASMSIFSISTRARMMDE